MPKGFKPSPQRMLEKIPASRGGGTEFGGWEKEALNRPLHDEFADFFKQPFRPSEPSSHDDDFSALMKKPFQPTAGPLIEPGIGAAGDLMKGVGLWHLAGLEALLLLEEFRTSYQEDWAYGTRPTLTLGAEWTRCANPTVACEVTWGPPDRQEVIPGSGSCVAIGACPTAQARSKSALMAVGAAVPITAGRIWLDRVTNYNLAPTTVAVTIVSNWWRVVPGTTRGPYIRNAVPMPRLKPVESDPLPKVEKRPHEPKTAPQPYMPPYAEPDWVRSPTIVVSPKTSRKPKTKTSAKRDKPRPPKPTEEPDRVAKPSPDVETKTLPKPQGDKGRGDPPVHYRVPDGKKKASMPPWLFNLMRMYHGATELMEAVDCMFDTLPADAKRGYAFNDPHAEWGHAKWTGIDKAARTFGNLDKVDWPKAIACMAYNQFIEDKAVGAFMRKLGKGFEGAGGPSTTQVTQWGRQMKGLR